MDEINSASLRQRFEELQARRQRLSEKIEKRLSSLHCAQDEVKDQAHTIQQMSSGIFSGVFSGPASGGSATASRVSVGESVFRDLEDLPASVREGRQDGRGVVYPDLSSISVATPVSGGAATSGGSSSTSSPGINRGVVGGAYQQSSQFMPSGRGAQVVRQQQGVGGGTAGGRILFSQHDNTTRQYTAGQDQTSQGRIPRSAE